jgi:Resolvase, N terminal domain
VREDFQRKGLRSARGPGAAEAPEATPGWRHAGGDAPGPLGAIHTGLLNVLDGVKQHGAGFRSLKDSWADTTTPHGTLMLTIVGGLAEFERSLIKARTGEGRERAMAKVVRFGCKVSTPTGSPWSPQTIIRVRARLAA